MQTARGFRRLLVLLAVLLGLTVSARADLSNGDFELGGTDWTPEGDVFFWKDIPDYPGNGTAVLWENLDYGETDADGDFDCSSISQGFSRLATETELHFDFTMTGPDTETDYFQLVLNDVPFLIASTAMPALNDGNRHHVVQDISGLGIADLHTLMFRLKGYDDNDVTTTVEIDNVQLSVVPVPGAFLLGCLGLSCAGWRLRRKTF